MGIGTEPVVVDRNDHISNSARFIRHWYRGYNSCSRTDLVFIPFEKSQLANKRLQRDKKAKELEREKQELAEKERQREKEKEKERYARKPDTPPANNSADAQISGPAHFQTPHSSTSFPHGGVVGVAYPGLKRQR
ncbi:putative arginine-glutamic acid dipeptide repeats protein-like [Apostichopus japonicus]|uniref:Putative arginine-glutamic acid dipeptide repeats protein-like n=1 Tax=Stichopus japonicus TaxID=307972 RepID=A0A2G8LF44_STIJA|nr:putative arginine-glutamic acid dipeptide repeats protein-like [Apostichopus japonicus]